jgi:hypothetical protein
MQYPFDNLIRLAIRKDGTIEVWNKPDGVVMAILDYRNDTGMAVVTEIGPLGIEGNDE